MKIAQESWLVVRYKINEQLRFERNLKNQDLNFYIPKITISIKKGANQKQVNKIEAIFPGYGFVRLAQTNLQALRNTLGLINIVRFGEQYAIAENTLVTQFKELESLSETEPILPKRLGKGDKIIITSGPFKGRVSEILATAAQDRVTILISLLGSVRAISFPVNEIQKY